MKYTRNVGVISAKIHVKTHISDLVVIRKDFCTIVVLLDASVYQDTLEITEIDVYDQTDVVIKNNLTLNFFIHSF